MASDDTPFRGPTINRIVASASPRRALTRPEGFSIIAANEPRHRGTRGGLP
jgi:hypothetical protein